MERVSSSAAPPPLTLSVFVDTSLDTHLAMVVSPEDTIGDLKDKIRTEHALCFPSIGEITIQSVKVRRKSSFYHLSGSMPMKNVFSGIKGSCFLHIDAVSACHQAGTAENVQNQNVRQSQKHQLLDLEPNATNMGSGEARVQIVIGSSDGKDLIPTDMNSEHEKQSFPDAHPQMLSVNNSFSLPHAGISNDILVCHDANVGVSTHMNVSANVLPDDRCMSPPETEKKSVADLPESLEPVCEGNVAVRSRHEPKTNQAVDQLEKDVREEDHCNLGVEAKDGFVSIKKQKSRKRCNVPWNDPLLEKDGSFVEKNKHKWKHDGTSQDPLANVGSGGDTKGTSILENIHPESSSQGKHENNPILSEKLGSTPPHDDCSPKNLTRNQKKKKNRKKEGASQFDDNNATAIPKTGTSDTSLEKTGAVVSFGKQVPEMDLGGALINNNRIAGEESDAALVIDKSTRNVTDGDSVEDHVNKESVEDACGKSQRDLNKESDALATIEEPRDHRNPSGDSEVPSKANVRNSRRNRSGKSGKTEIPNLEPDSYGAVHSLGEQISQDNSKEMTGYQHIDPDKESILGEATVLVNATVEDSTVPSVRNETSSRRRRKKSAKAELPNHGSLNKEPFCSSTKGASEENPMETLEDIHKQQGKESKLASLLGEGAPLEGPGNIIGEATVLVKATVEDSTVPSVPNETSSRRRRKKAAKVELPNHGSLNKEPFCSSTKGASEENPMETLEDIQKQQGKESKLASLLGEGAPLEGPGDINLAIPSNTNDKSLPHQKRKKGKAEVSYPSNNHDLDHSSGKALGTTHRDLVDDSNGDTTPGETAQNLAHGNHIDVNSTGLVNDTSKKHDVPHYSIKKVAEEDTKELLGMVCDNSGKETRQNGTHKMHAKSFEENDHMELQKSDSGKISFIESFLPKAGQLESLTSAQELLSMKPETRISHKEKIKRKRKSNMHSEDSTHDLVNPPCLDTQYMLKKKSQDSGPGNHGLVDSAVHLTAREPKAKKPHKEKIERSTSDVHLGDTSSGLVEMKNLHDNNMLEMKRQVCNNDKHHQVLMSKHEESKHLKGKTSAVSERENKSIPYLEGNNIMVSADNNQQPQNFDASVRSSLGAEPATQNDSSACADVSIKETMADLAASSESTKEGTPYQRKQYRVAVRKAPSKRFRKNMNNTGQEKTLSGTSGTIFNGIISGSSEDNFEADNKKATSKVWSDNSSTSDDSDGDLGETQVTSSVNPRACMNSPGVDSVVYGKNDEGIDDIILTQPSSVAIKSKPLSMILRSTSSYLTRKAKLTASQSQPEDSESQPVDTVLETQPELA